MLLRKKLEGYTLSDAQFDAITHKLPVFVDYYAGVKDFLKASKGWLDLDDHFYTVGIYGFNDSSYNSNGGLDVAWAFYRKKRGKSVDKPTIKKMYKWLVKEHVDDLLDDLEYSLL